jgi:hypothetical protein
MSADTKASALACALTAADYKQRLAWIDELNPAATARVREFVDREQACCPFLEFTIHEGEKAVLLVIKVPEDAREAADVLLGSYTAQGAAT